MSEYAFTSDWDVYFCYLEDLPAFISVDLGVAKAAPMAEKPVLLEVMVALRTTGENGFPEDREWTMLEKIEDALVSTLEKKLGVLFVAKTLNNGKRGFYFYTGETLLLEQTMEAIAAEFADYTIAYQETEDEEWSIYFEYLYPNEESLLKIYNSRLLLHLEEQGDQAYIPRPITHEVYFASEPDRASFVAAVKKEGFVVASQEITKEGSALPYRLVLNREDKPVEKTINDLTARLRQLAEQHQGRYEGWQTEVVSEND